jgi:hypothetical protein
MITIAISDTINDLDEPPAIFVRLQESPEHTDETCLKQNSQRKGKKKHEQQTHRRRRRRGFY